MVPEEGWKWRARAGLGGRGARCVACVARAGAGAVRCGGRGIGLDMPPTTPESRAVGGGLPHSGYVAQNIAGLAARSAVSNNPIATAEQCPASVTVLQCEDSGFASGNG